MNDILYELVEVEKFESKSKDFELNDTKPKQHGKYIPPITHPWKHASFINYLYKQKRYQDSANIYR